MDLYKYNTSDFITNEIDFSETLTYFYTDTLSEAFIGSIEVDFVYENGALWVSNSSTELYFYNNISFVCDLAEIEGVQGTPYIEYLDLFNRLTKEFDRIFFNSEETEIFALNGTLIDTTITTKHISYAMSITSVLMVFIGFISFFKWLFRIVGGR